MTEEFKQKIAELHLQTYTDTNLCDMQWGTALSWEFTKLYNHVPKYFTYSASVKTDLQIYSTAHLEDYDDVKSFLAIKKEYDGEYVQYSDAIYTDDGIITTDNIIYWQDKMPERIKKCLKVIEQKHHFLFASMGSNGFTTRNFPIKNVEEDIMDNYNDDIPLDKFKEFVEMDRSGIAIMNGIPGCGKTYFIRKLISDYPDRQFIWFDQSLLTQATSDAFVQFILSHRDSILILEDCELLITSRDKQQNGILNTVLNIADGIIGDSLKIKFICTFNTDLTNVDKALLRKGRLKIKYEFKKLTKEKVVKLFEKFGIKDTPKEMALCDIYNYEEVNGAEVKEHKKIGF